MDRKQWLRVVLFGALVVTPALAKKGGGGNGGGDGGNGTPPTIGEVVYFDYQATSEIKPDGSGAEIVLPYAGDPSNQSFASGARWYLVVRATEQLPRFENGVIVEFLDVENIFAVNSVTGDEVQVTNFAGAYLYIENLKAKWSRDSGDLLITFIASDEIDYAKVVDGQIGYDFGVDWSDYDETGNTLFALSVSSVDIDAAYELGGGFTPVERADVIRILDAPGWVSDFKVSPDLAYGSYRLGLESTVFDLGTGASVLDLGDARDLSWTPGSNVVYYRFGEGIYETELSTSGETLIASPSDRRLSGYGNPVMSPDGRSLAFTAGRRLKGNSSELVLYSQNLDGSGMTELSVGATPIRWVED